MYGDIFVNSVSQSYSFKNVYKRAEFSFFHFFAAEMDLVTA